MIIIISPVGLLVQVPGDIRAPGLILESSQKVCFEFIAHSSGTRYCLPNSINNDSSDLISMMKAYDLQWHSAETYFTIISTFFSSLNYIFLIFSENHNFFPDQLFDKIKYCHSSFCRFITTHICSKTYLIFTIKSFMFSIKDSMYFKSLKIHKNHAFQCLVQGIRYFY